MVENKSASELPNRPLESSYHTLASHKLHGVNAPKGRVKLAQGPQGACFLPTLLVSLMIFEFQVGSKVFRDGQSFNGLGTRMRVGRA